MSFAMFCDLNRQLWSVVFPAILSQITLCLVETISLLFIGQMNNTFMTAGVGLGMTFINFTVQAPMAGLNSPISVLVALAFG